MRKSAENHHPEQPTANKTSVDPLKVRGDTPGRICPRDSKTSPANLGSPTQHGQSIKLDPSVRAPKSSRKRVFLNEVRVFRNIMYFCLTHAT